MDGFLPCSPRVHIPIQTVPPQPSVDVTPFDLTREALSVGRATGLSIALEHLRACKTVDEAIKRITEARDRLAEGPKRSEAQPSRRARG